MFPKRYLLSILASVFFLANVTAAQQPPADSTNYQYVGCLMGSPGAFALAGENSYYTLTGETAGLEKHVGEEIGVDGPKDNSGDPNPIVHVERFGVVFHAPPSRLDPRFTKGKWTIHRNEQYGIEFALPDFLKLTRPSKKILE